MLLCGEPSSSTKSFSCFKKATTLLVTDHWHEKKYVMSLLESYLSLNNKAAKNRMILTVSWPLKDRKHVVNTPDVISVYYTGSSIRLFFPADRSPDAPDMELTNLGIAHLEGLEYQTASMRWEPMPETAFKDIILWHGDQTVQTKGINHNTIAMRQLTGENQYSYYAVYKVNPVLPAPSITTYLESGVLEANCELSTISAQNLFHELKDKHSLALLFTDLLEMAPDLSLPLFKYLDSNPKHTATVLTTNPNLVQDVDRLFAGDSGVVMSFSTDRLIRLDELSANQVRSIFRQISEASMFTKMFRPSHEQMIRTLQICGLLPDARLNLHCYRHHINDVSDYPPQ